MGDSLRAWRLVEKLLWQDVLLVLAVLILARLLVLFVRWALHQIAEKAPPYMRLTVLRLSPISRLWSASVFNASSGNRSLLCVADFYLHPDHDGFAV